MAVDSQPPKAGRPMKYASLILKLDQDALYSAAAIAHFARRYGYVKGSKQAQKETLRRIKSAAAYIQKHYIKEPSDGFLTFPGQRPVEAWYGRHWIDAVKERKRQLRNHNLRRKRLQRKRKKGK